MDREQLLRENRALRDRLSRLSDASLRINESLDYDAVLQGALDSARTLPRGRFGVIALIDERGRKPKFLTSGLSSEESRFPAATASGPALGDSGRRSSTGRSTPGEGRQRRGRSFRDIPHRSRYSHTFTGLSFTLKGGRPRCAERSFPAGWAARAVGPHVHPAGPALSCYSITVTVALFGLPAYPRPL